VIFLQGEFYGGEGKQVGSHRLIKSICRHLISSKMKPWLLKINLSEPETDLPD